MLGRVTAAAALTLLVACVATAYVGPEIHEYEDAIVVTENERSALLIALERNAETGNRRVRLSTLYDPYGEPYVSIARERRSPAAIDWGVEECRVGGRVLGPYLGDTPHRTFERWTRGTAADDHAEIRMQRAWLDPDNGKAIVLETASLMVHAQQYYRRAIDIHVRLVNVGTEPVVLPGDASFVVRFDSGQPEAGFRTPENEYRSAPFRYRGPWLSGSSMSLSRMKMMGVALFNDALARGGDAAQFVAHRDGTLEMSAAPGPTTLEVGESTEWSVRVFCFADKLPAKAIQDSYLGFLSGRTW